MNNNIKKLIPQIKKQAKKYFQDSSGCHDWSHVERVKKLALDIGRKERADLNILEIAVFLHDIGRKQEMRAKGTFCHAEQGAELARNILEKYKLGQAVIESIIHCIKCHRYRNNNIPQTIEAKILFDADKLDSIGAVGLARAFLFAGGHGSKILYTGNERRLAQSKKDFSYTKEDSAILEYEIRLKQIKNILLTSRAKKIAQERSRFMKEFIQRFWLEVEGKL